MWDCSLHFGRGWRQEGAVKSLYDELTDKLGKAPKLTKPSVARFDLGLLLFNAGDALRELEARTVPNVERRLAHEHVPKAGAKYS